MNSKPLSTTSEELGSEGLVLVVDDDPRNRLLAEGYLEAAGYEVSLAASGSEALDTLRDLGAEAFDLVLLDILMPDLDGFETCRRIRLLPGGEDTPILFLTALDDADSYQKALAAGGDDYLAKPVRQAELLLRVRSLVRMKSLLTELRSHRDALLVAQEQRRRLTRMIVHDLKGPIQAILGYAELLHSQSEGSAKSSKYSSQVLRAGARLHDMVVSVLEAEESVDSRISAIATSLDLPAILERVLEKGRELAGPTGHTLSLRNDAEPSLTADEGLLERVLVNLVQNAVQHTPVCAVEIYVSSAPVGHRVEVRDLGPGIPEDMRERIFEPHFNLLPTKSVRNRGLGLAFCRLAVRAHGGQIWIEDNQPQGSRFCFTIPSDRNKSGRSKSGRSKSATASLSPAISLSPPASGDDT
jgi:two-component system, sensor histidine kinase and response regulator